MYTRAALSLLYFFLALPIMAQHVWMPVDSTRGERAWDIDCVDSLNCLLIGEVGLGLEVYVLQSTDGGTTWKKVHSDTGRIPLRRYPLRLLQVEYVTPNLALVSVDSGYILRTQDGGKSWEEIEVTDRRRALRGPIDMYDSLNGICVVRNPGPPEHIWDRLFKTTDGGKTWHSTETLPRTEGWERQTILGISCIGQDRYLTLMLYKEDNPTAQLFSLTTDGGKTWTFSESPLDLTELFGLPDFHFFDSLHGIMTGAQRINNLLSFVIETRDGGLSWSILHNDTIEGRSRTGGMLNSDFYDRNYGIAGVPRGIVRTTDGGRTWHRDSIAFPWRYTGGYYVELTSSSSGVAAGIHGAIFRWLSTTSSVDLTGDKKPLYDLQLTPSIVSNGTKTFAQINLPHHSPVSLKVFDVTGNIVLTVPPQLIKTGRWKLPISTDEFSSGMYFVAVTVNSTEYVQKLLVQ